MPSAIATGPEKKEVSFRGTQGASKEDWAMEWAFG